MADITPAAGTRHTPPWGLAGRTVGRFVNALVTPLLPGDYLDLFHPLRKGADLRGRVMAVERHSSSATTVTIRPGRGWSGHRPGQYIRIGVEVNGVRLWRAYSITSRVGQADGLITITVRAIPDGKVSHHVLRNLRPGTIVMLDQATGDFTQPSRPPAKVLFLTAGSGITPVMGMLRNHQFEDAVVVHSSPDPSQMLFADELHSRASRGQFRLVERFTSTEGTLPVSSIADVVPDWAERIAWVCGPTGLLDDAEAHWEQEGASALLHVERFRPRIIAEGEGGSVTFTQSDVTVDAPAATPLLDVGEDAGVLMPSGCRMGICFNCVASLTSGAVRDLRTGETTQAIDEDPVLIQTCVSAAAGPCSIKL
ncbi:ferredoxin reductase [Tessaracoccus antarcticus]|uniref:Ferredoxin reductase n=1 Tax=Tessaracoccus antarcticus TaxID=2479848 RepID=A0A3M0G8B7_9ACTN|nr:ferredoxin reductase [Tessaracoccus antarcticus]RMB61281.1 ferredoxin reductase [Tessaracoccus antarcticus]